MEYYHKSECRLCSSTALECVVQLTPTPPGNHFVSKQQLDIAQSTYPLELNFCNNCKHVQLGHVVDAKILYQKNYTYVSATSPVFVQHLQDYAQEVLANYPLPKDSLILDIGSNDGTALSFFQAAGYKVLGIDPAIEVVANANKKGIETLCEFFSFATAKKYLAQYGKAKLINSHNACAHIDELSNVIEGVKYWLADDGLFVLEVGYLFDIVHNTWFDTIYHEHLDYHALFPLVTFFARMGMQVISAKRVAPQGGSVRVVVQKHGGPFKIDGSVGEILAFEEESKLNTTATLHKFAAQIQQVKQNLTALIAVLKQQGKTIAGFGAPTKATTLLTHFDLGDKLDFLVDDNPLKQGLYSPGSHIPVYAADSLNKFKPDYLLILAWNFADSIMSRNKAYKEAGGKFIIPMPEAIIV